MKKIRTIKDFLKELKKYRGAFRTSDYGRIRAGNNNCPIEVVGKSGNAFVVGKRMGLTERQIFKIVDASDNVGTFTGQKNLTLRKKIMRAVGL